MTLATTIFGLSLVANLYLLAFSGIFSGGSSRQVTVVQGEGKDKIAVIAIDNVIMSEAAQRLDRLLTLAEHDATVKALVLEIDSPGGAVTASDEMYHRLLQFKEERHVPVVVSMGSLATSGGYYVSCAADDIVAEPTTMTGNIGVLLPRFNAYRLMDKIGVEENTIVSSGTPFKNAGSPFLPDKPQDTAYLQGIADNAFRRFKAVVVQGRGSKLTRPIDEIAGGKSTTQPAERSGQSFSPIDVIANGKVYMADEALKLGLVDQIGYRDTAYDLAAKRANLTKKTVVRYEDSPSLLQLLSSEGRSNLASPGAHGELTINAVNVNLDSRSLQELFAPRLMYLWRGE